MKSIRIQRPRARRERDWGEALPPDPRDPDVIRAKALGPRRQSPPAEVTGRAVTAPRRGCERADGTRPCPQSKPAATEITS